MSGAVPVDPVATGAGHLRQLLVRLGGGVPRQCGQIRRDGNGDRLVVGCVCRVRDEVDQPFAADAIGSKGESALPPDSYG
ncbi:MAG: hypothetical protein MPJ50_05950, partial [Pirellulales bacterium]|nr:hypothetical protein [Pirellulales bacterium]